MRAVVVDSTSPSETPVGPVTPAPEPGAEVRRAAARLSLIARVTQSVVASLPLEEQMRAIADQVCEAFEVDACVIRVLEGDDLVLLAESGTPPRALPERLPARRGISAEILVKGAPLAIGDVAEHPLTAHLWRSPVPGNFRFRGYAGAPLLVEGRVEGILGVYSVDAPRDFGETDLEHLQILANYAAVARANDRLYRDLRRSKEELEERVREREDAYAALRATEARFQAIFEHAFDAIAVIDGEGVLAYCNPAYVRMFGFADREEVLGRSPREFIVPAEREQAHRTEQEIARGAQPGVVEYRCRRVDGSEFLVEGQASAYSLDGRTYVAAVLRDVTERRAAEQAQATLLRQQQRIAQTLQRALLLAPPEDAVAGLSLRPLYEPAWDEALVGGDFYDIFPLTETQVALVVGDIAGKGLTAAAETVQTKFALRALLREHYRPDLALQRLNRFLEDAPAGEGVHGGSLVALTVAVIDAETGLVTLSTAGSEPALLVRRNGGQPGAASIEKIATGGLVLRADPDARYDAVLFQLEPGDVLAIMTDGVTEARRGGTMFAETGLDAALLRAVGRESSLEVMGRSVIDAAKFFSGGALRDDVCLVLARRRAPVAAPLPDEQAGKQRRRRPAAVAPAAAALAAAAAGVL